MPTSPEVKCLHPTSSRRDSGQSPLSRRIGYLIGDITLICLFHYASNSKL